MNNEKRLMKNTIIYAIGNFGSKALSFFIVPLYTYYLSVEEMGTYDLILVVISFLSPLVTLQLYDGVYRWLLGDSEKKVVIKTGLCMFSIPLISCLIVGWIISSYAEKTTEGIIIVFLLILQAVNVMLMQIVRGLKHNKLYASLGVVYTILFLAFNVFGIICLNMGIHALLLSQILSFLFVNVIILLKEKIIFYSLVHGHLDSNIFFEMLKYSIPLIPNVLCWSIINMSDRIIIAHCLGTSFNGIYAVSCKFPMIMQLFTNFFYLAWQEIAIDEYQKNDKDKIYSDIFNKYCYILLSIIIIVLPVTFFYTEIFMANQYKECWLYTGYLYLGSVFCALSSFLGVGYQASKNSKGALVTSLIAAFSNLFINIALINVIGLQAAPLSTFIAYLLLFLIRYFNTKRFLKLEIKWIKLLVCFIFIICFVVCYNFDMSNIVRLIFSLVSCGLYLCYVIYLIYYNKFISKLMKGKNNELDKKK